MAIEYRIFLSLYLKGHFIMLRIVQDLFVKMQHQFICGQLNRLKNRLDQQAAGVSTPLLPIPVQLCEQYDASSIMILKHSTFSLYPVSPTACNY